LIEGQNKVCVEFQRLQGRQTTFLKHYENFKNEKNCLKFANDTTLHPVEKEEEKVDA